MTHVASSCNLQTAQTDFGSRQLDTSEIRQKFGHIGHGGFVDCVDCVEEAEKQWSSQQLTLLHENVQRWMWILMQRYTVWDMIVLLMHIWYKIV